MPPPLVEHRITVAVAELIKVSTERYLNPLSYEMTHTQSSLIKRGLNVTVMIYGTIKPHSVSVRNKSIWIISGPKHHFIETTQVDG
jgi:hypothetical protein